MIKKKENHRLELTYFAGKVKVKSAFGPSGASGRRLTGMPVHCRVTGPSIKFPGTYLYTWVERGTVRVKVPLTPKFFISRQKSPFCSDHIGEKIIVVRFFLDFL